VKPMAAAVAGAVISGVGMYAIGTHAQDRLASTPAAVPGYYVAAPQPIAQPVGTLGYTAPPVATPVVARTITPPRTVRREGALVPRVETQRRSLAKTALIIGGSTAGAAGLGGLLGGKKGALVGAALGGGAASIYEATRR